MFDNFDEVGQRFMDMGFVAEKRRIVARGNLKGQRRSVRGFVDELLKQRAHVAEIGFQRDAVGVRFCAANERAQVFDRMADDIDFAVAGHLFIQQRRTPVDFVEIVFERMGDILRVALQNFAAAAAPIIGSDRAGNRTEPVKPGSCRRS